MKSYWRVCGIQNDTSTQRFLTIDRALNSMYYICKDFNIRSEKEKVPKIMMQSFFLKEEVSKLNECIIMSLLREVCIDSSSNATYLPIIEMLCISSF